MERNDDVVVDAYEVEDEHDALVVHVAYKLCNTFKIKSIQLVENRALFTLYFTHCLFVFFAFEPWVLWLKKKTYPIHDAWVAEILLDGASHAVVVHHSDRTFLVAHDDDPEPAKHLKLSFCIDKWL